MLTLTLVITIFAIVIGASFQFGYQVGVLNEPEELINEFIRNVSEARGSPLPHKTIITLSSFVISALPIGGVCGALSAGYLANRFGRRNGLLLLTIPTVVGIVCMFVCWYVSSYEILIIGRLIMGISCGAYSGVAPMYLSEIAPISIKGASGTLHQFAIVIGILISQVLGLPACLGTTDLWHVLLGLAAIPCALQCVLLPFCPESPHYVLFSKHDEDTAKRELSRLRDSHGIEEELSVMITEARRTRNSVNVNVLQLFQIPHLRYAMLIAIGIHIAQQLSGINALMLYSSSIFASTGMGPSTSTLATLGMGVVNVLVTLVSVLLVDRLGRRTLYLVGLVGMLAFTILLTVALALTPALGSGWGVVSIVAIYGYVAVFAIGPGSIPWFIVAEMFTQDARGSAVTVAVFVNWLCQIIMGLGYPQLQTYLKEYSFVPFIVTLALFVVFTFVWVPETKGRSSEEMERYFKAKTTPGVVYGPLLEDGGVSVNTMPGDEGPVSEDPLSFTTRSMVNADGTRMIANSGQMN